MSYAGLSLNICRRASLSGFSLISKQKQCHACSTTLTSGLTARCQNSYSNGGIGRVSASGARKRRYATSASKTALKLEEERDAADVVYEGQVEAQRQRSASRKLKEHVCALLRDVAQPVAVVTSILPPSNSPANSINEEEEDSDAETDTVEEDGVRAPKAVVYHGATLSSFTSIAMDPYPLVAFALRIPSRMAAALTAIASADGSGVAGEQAQAHMVVNLLAAGQAATAVKFSRPDLYPAPFGSVLPAASSSSSTSTSTSSSSLASSVPYTLSEDRLPIIDGSVGAISCRLVGKPIPLFDLDYLEPGTATGMRPEKAIMPPLKKGEVASELFIARVLRVETVRREGAEAVEDDSDCERPLPLVYHRRSYTSCHPKP